MRKRLKFNCQRSALSGQLSDERGVALILTLSIITLVTLLLIAFAVSMRVENTASKNFNEVVKAREFAQAAMDQAVATIRDATTRNANVLNYATFPGVIYDLDISQTPPAVRKTLYSENANSKFDFNEDFWITAQNGEFPGAGNAVMNNVGWIYVADDGTLAPPNAYPMPTTKSIIGRFAFWVDDEASKININTAGQAPPSADPYGYSGQDQVNVLMLISNMNAFAADVESGGATYPRGTYPYATIEEVKRANTGISADIFNANRFSITAYSDDKDDLDALGDKRSGLDLSTLTEAKDITDLVGPDSAYARLSDNTKLPKVYSANRGFAFKYPIVGGLDGLKQIIANIIAYQLDPRTPADLAKLPDAVGDPPAYLGLIRAPYVNEVKVTYDAIVGIIRTVTVELFYPYGADGSSYMTGPADTIVVGGLPAVGTLGTSPASPILTIPGGLVFNSATPYRTFSYSPGDSDPTFAPAGPVTLLATTATVNYYRNLKRLDCAQVPLPNVGILAGAVSWHGAEVNDPCVNEKTTEWTPYRNPNAGTPGAVNSVYAPPGGDSSKVLIRGLPILSVGELGYIHTPNSWTHLRLQPQSAAEKAVKLIPDWAMLDMFTVPNAKTGGRININSYINPGLNPAVPVTQRLVPLKSLLSSVVLPGSLQTVAQNIYGNISGGIYVNPPDTFGIEGAYDAIGEICEVQGMDNGGLTEADKEAIIRRIANLITVRSNTFTVWVIAQSIKEPTGVGTVGMFDTTSDLITGEVRMQAVVERYENPPGTPNFRVKYFRYL